MELKQYARIVWRRLWIPIALLAIVAAVSLLTNQAPPPFYGLAQRFNIGVESQAVAQEYLYDGYYALVSSEYVADSLTEIASGQLFADDVNRHLAESGSALRLTPGTITAETKHRTLRVSLTWPNPEELDLIGQAIEQTMLQDVPGYFPQFSASSITVRTFDQSGPFLANPPSLRQRLDLPIRLVLALVAGIGLAFLLDYLDDSVRERSELEAMGLSVLAEVPKQ
jgi:capsular polysaccharide biosynthesis protein